MAEDSDLYNRRWGPREYDLAHQAREAAQKDRPVVIAARHTDGELERDLSGVDGVVGVISGLAPYLISSDERNKYRGVIADYLARCYHGEELSVEAVKRCIMEVRLINPRVYLKCLDSSEGYTPDQAKLVFAALREKFAPDIGDDKALVPNKDSQSAPIKQGDLFQ